MKKKIQTNKEKRKLINWLYFVQIFSEVIWISFKSSVNVTAEKKIQPIQSWSETNPDPSRAVPVWGQHNQERSSSVHQNMFTVIRFNIQHI